LSNTVKGASHADDDKMRAIATSFPEKGQCFQQEMMPLLNFKASDAANHLCVWRQAKPFFCRSLIEHQKHWGKINAIRYDQKFSWCNMVIKQYIIPDRA